MRAGNCDVVRGGQQAGWAGGGGGDRQGSAGVGVRRQDELGGVLAVGPRRERRRLPAGGRAGVTATLGRVGDREAERERVGTELVDAAVGRALDSYRRAVNPGVAQGRARPVGLSVRLRPKRRGRCSGSCRNVKIADHVPVAELCQRRGAPAQLGAYLWAQCRIMLERCTVPIRKACARSHPGARRQSSCDQANDVVEPASAPAPITSA